MKKLKLPTLLIINLLFVFWPPKSITSCGFFLYKEEYRFWTFDPTNSGEPGLQPLFYSLDYNHQGFETRYDYYDAETQLPDEYGDNIKLWLGYCYKLDSKTRVKSKDIETVLYNTEPVEYFKIKDGLIEQNTFLNFASKHPALLSYLDYAKKSEYQSNEHSTWECSDCPKIEAPGKIIPSLETYNGNYEYGVSPDPINGIEIVEEGKKLINTCSDDFLKQRYAYQIVRTSYYNLDSASLREYYYTYLNKMPTNNWLKNNALMYEVLFRDEVQCNIGLTKIFEICPDKRYRCEELFKNELFEPTLKLAKSNSDKAMVYVMHCLQKPYEQLPTIKTIISLNPKNKFLPFLWVREINKLEDWILGETYTVGSTKNESLFSYQELTKEAAYNQKQKDLMYSKEVLAALETGLKDGSIPATGFYKLCAGYIAFINKDLAKANAYYSAIKLSELAPVGQTQLLINKLMLSLSQTPKVTPQIEDDLAACLVYLKNNSAQNKQYTTLQMQLINFAAKEFRERGEPAKGLMLYGKSSQPYAYHPLNGVANVYTQIYTYATPSQIDEQLYILHKPNPNAFEKYLRGPIYTDTYNYGYPYDENKKPWSQDKLLDLKSMKLVQQDKLLLALDALKKIDTSYWSNDVNSLFRFDDPFCLNPWNGHDEMNYKNVSYNKRTFLEELITLKTKAANAKGEEKAKMLLKIANAYYAMTYNGKFWIMQKNYHMGYDPNDSYTDVDPTYYSGARAKYYYKQILQNSSDPKLLGACIYILNTAFETNAAQLAKNRAFIKGNSNATDYYEQLSNNCDLFYEFIKTYN
ncbi:MAG: hypothetical protein CFE21_00535 [Bacteroidetes bacterium B1(2017)]|nr:MAG: hypothetical protein CFE21_00535 [Bacteroidetes bacterium B1(2017)]